MNIEYVFDETLRNCPLCNSSSFVRYETAVNRGATLHYHICRRCGIIFQSPRMKADAVERFYQNDYRATDVDDERPMQWVIEQEQSRASYQTNLLAEWIKPPRRILDIGASTGQLLQMTSSKFGSVGLAVEPGDVYRSTLKEKFTVYSSVDALIAAGQERFDLVIMSHVLEHLPEPIRFLHSLREHVISSDGFLFVEVPNVYGHSCFEPAHLYAFTEKTLTMTLKAAGFDVVQLKTHSAPKTFGWRSISALIKPSTQIQPVRLRQFVVPRWIQFQRVIGRSGTRHWYGYLYQQIYKKLVKK